MIFLTVCCHVMPTMDLRIKYASLSLDKECSTGVLDASPGDADQRMMIRSALTWS